MGNQFKPGDMALVIASAFQENNGCQVELVEFVPHGSMISSVLTEQDFYNESGEGIWYVIGRVVNPQLELAGESFFRERQLMPLRGYFEPEQQKAREVELCA
ncbi:hypothetical protein NDO41_08115 [Ectopseudomonas mendocina]|nr:hypothetical protein NDO41_08115 [Pseudomonas mendocina]